MFSVVIPVHNKAPHVARSIQSVLDQTYKNFELIIIDDASTDSSMDEVAKFDDPRIRIFKRDEPGPGGYAARNLGIERANAEWIAFLDADDQWDPTYLENAIKLYEIFPDSKILFSGWRVIRGKEIKENKYYKKKTLIGSHKISKIDYLKVHASGIDICHTNVTIVKKSFLQQIGGFPEVNCKCKRAGDGQTWLKAMMTGIEGAWGDFIGATYHKDSINMVTEMKDYRLNENCLVTFLRKAIESHRYPNESRYLKQYLRTRVRTHLISNAKKGLLGLKHVRELKYYEFYSHTVFLSILAILPSNVSKSVVNSILRLK